MFFKIYVSSYLLANIRIDSVYERLLLVKLKNKPFYGLIVSIIVICKKNCVTVFFFEFKVTCLLISE